MDIYSIPEECDKKFKWSEGKIDDTTGDEPGVEPGVEPADEPADEPIENLNNLTISTKK